MSATTPTAEDSSANSLEHWVSTYGDMLYDLCFSLLPTPQQVSLAFRSILRKLKSESRKHQYSVHERSWVLRVSCEILLKLCQLNPQESSAEDHIRLDANPEPEARLKKLDSYFRRLPPEDRLLFLLKEKLEIPYSEISTALGIPESSLKIRRQQALRSLEEWLWSARSEHQ